MTELSAKLPHGNDQLIGVVNIVNTGKAGKRL